MRLLKIYVRRRHHVNVKSKCVERQGKYQVICLWCDSSKLDYDSVNNEEVGSCPDLENTSLREISLIGHYGWQRKEFDLQNCDGTFVAKGHVMGPNSLRSTKILSCCHPFCTPLHSLIWPSINAKWMRLMEFKIVVV
jgi:hypothetical protein